MPSRKKLERDLYMTPREYEVFRKYAYEFSAIWGLFFDILCYGGLRVSEGLAIYPADIDYEENSITINTLKKRKPVRDMIKYPPRTIQALRTMIIGMKRPQNKPVFDWTRGRAWLNFKNILRQVPSLNQRHSLHSLRHCHGIFVLELTGDATTASKRLRHSNLDMTYRYLHLTDNIQDMIVDGLREFTIDPERGVNKKEIQRSKLSMYPIGAKRPKGKRPITPSANDVVLKRPLNARPRYRKK